MYLGCVNKRPNTWPEIKLLISFNITFGGGLREKKFKTMKSKIL